MTTPRDLEPAKPSDWETVLAGKRLPHDDDPDDLEADAIRQTLLWRHARRNTELVNAQQAELFYQQIHMTEPKPSPWSRWGRGILMSLAMLGVGFGAGYLMMQSQPTKPTTTLVAQTGIGSAALGVSATAHDEMIAADSLASLPVMVSIPAGGFMMGCSAGWDDEVGGCRDNELPAHWVDVPAFAMGKFEVTVGQFRQFVQATQYLTTAEVSKEGCTIADPKLAGKWLLSQGSNWSNPGFAQTDAHPAVCISWRDAEAYTQWLSVKTGQSYRLPTEAEWEYAARAGKVTAYFWGSQPNRNYANFVSTGETDSWSYSSPVGQFSSNAFGLYDVAGNAWEWVADCWQPNYLAAPEVSCANETRVRRGGSWDNQPPSIRSAYRSSGKELERSYLYGFRVARTNP